MFNMLRMDLYRIKRSKSVYICLAAILSSIFLCYGTIYMMATSEGQVMASKIGMNQLAENSVEEYSDLLSELDSIEMLRESCMGGGAYNLFFGIVVVLFVCMDFQSGFIKNILTLHRDRWKYIGSKLMLAGIVDFCYIVLGIGFSSLMNVLLHLVPFAAWKDILFYLAWTWLMTMAFAALMIMICIFTRSVAASIGLEIVLSSGMLVVMLSSFMGLFNADGWSNYTIYFNMRLGASRYASPADLKVFVIGSFFLIVYTIAAIIKNRKQDI